MLTDKELEEIRKRHNHEWDDGFEDIPLLIDEIGFKNVQIALLGSSLKSYAKKVEDMRAEIDKLMNKLTIAGNIVDAKQAEIERLRSDLAMPYS